MARELDLDNLSREDLMYMRQRPWLVADAVRRGYGDIPERIKELDSESTNVSEEDNGGSDNAESSAAGNVQGDPAGADGSDDGSDNGDDDDSDDSDSSDMDEEEEEDEEEEDEDVDYDSWTVPELKEELKERNLSTDGKKDELIARLVKDDTKDD